METKKFVFSMVLLAVVVIAYYFSIRGQASQSVYWLMLGMCAIGGISSGTMGETYNIGKMLPLGLAFISCAIPTIGIWLFYGNFIVIALSILFFAGVRIGTYSSGLAWWILRLMP